MEMIIGKTMLCAYGYLGAAADKLDELTMGRALSAGVSDKGGGTAGGLTTYEQVDRILDLVNKKVRLCSLKATIDETLNQLSYEEQLILKMRYIQGLKFEYFGDILKYTKRTYFRRIDTALKKFCGAMARNGYSDEWFEKEYMNQKWIKNLYRKLYKSSISSNSSKNEGILA